MTFDAAGTLLSPYPSVGYIYAEVMHHYGLDLDEHTVETAFAATFKKLQTEPRQNLSEETEKAWWRKILRQTLAGLGQPTDFNALFEDLWNTFTEARRWRLPADAVPSIRALKERGFRVAVLSNWDHRLRLILEETGISGLFQAIFISSEIGIEKPDPGIFKFAERQFGLAAENFLHVGDSRKHDLEGAQNVGWNALLINHKTEDKQDDYQIHRFDQLLDLLPTKC